MKSAMILLVLIVLSTSCLAFTASVEEGKKVYNITSCDKFSDSITIVNQNNESAKTTLVVHGDFVGWLDIIKEIDIEPNSQKIIDYSIIPPNKTGVYSGGIAIGMKGSESGKSAGIQTTLQMRANNNCDNKQIVEIAYLNETNELPEANENVTVTVPVNQDQVIPVITPQVTEPGKETINNLDTTTIPSNGEKNKYLNYFWYTVFALFLIIIIVLAIKLPNEKTKQNGEVKNENQ